ncbi:Ribosomal RNA small subunit methyltransferase J [Gossypium australe]|uniref:Ribosomal RNA small subunit methyltransferase J n=1 Tax=Gossypium australe TaxID=47621 RepID=A0A5B6VZ32_9ROSI|nr:Ribosomal RNA small subunit methyltransferase J [Gossypium australe]
MASISSSSSSSSSSFTFTASSPFLSRPKLGTHPFPPALLSIPRLTPRKTPNLSLSLTTAAATSKSGGENAVPSKNPKMTKKEVVEEDEAEVEEELPWIQEKALELVEFTGSVTQAIPGPRVGTSSLPWILAVPSAYAGITFVNAFVKTVKKFTSPRHQGKKLVKLFLKSNAMLCKSIDELFQQGSDAVDNSTLKGLVQKILRKYIRYSLNEKPWSADLISSLIQLRKASMLDDSQIAEILSEISRRIIFTWNLGGWGKCKSKQLQFTDERIPVRGSNTMVQFHQDQVHFLVVHETQLSIYEAKELGCVQQWIPEDSTRISQATLSCDSQMTRGKIS